VAAEQRRFAAILIDFENIYYYLRQNLSERQEVSDVVAGLVQRLRRLLIDRYNEEAISLDAYADFERIDENAQGSLYLIGVETHNVLGTDHKNAADMKLCIDALTILYTRQEIASFVVVAGDRDYIPVIQHLRKHGKTVRQATFSPTSARKTFSTPVSFSRSPSRSACLQQVWPDRLPACRCRCSLWLRPCAIPSPCGSWMRIRTWRSAYYSGISTTSRRCG
jgi:uncharacterized LabA/DUF88 family protein